MMRKQLMLIVLMLLCALPVMGQDLDAEGGYQEALRRIEEARVSGATELYLAGLGLTKLPVELFQLTQLQILDLSSNQLTSLSPEIGQLVNLYWLNLAVNKLSVLPSTIGQLVNLEALYLDSNCLSSLPPEIGQLARLQELYLSGNRMRNLPLEFGQLINLNVLALNADTITTFPPFEIQHQGAQAVVAYLRDYHAMLVRQTIAAIAAGIGGVTLLILGFRWQQRRGLSEKKKRA